MRDLHLRHTLKLLTRDASAVFADLQEAGQEIPYEIAEQGESFAFCQYRPLTAKFVRDNATELRELDSFREATETMRRTELAAAYLDEAGIVPSGDPVERSTLAVTYFLARMWEGCSDFEIDEDRFTAALEEIEECAEPEAGEVEAIVPLLGFQTSASRVDLTGAAIVRADTVDVPPEAARSDRPPGAEWQPTFVISARVELDPDGGLSGAGDRVARTFERVVTVLRLHRPGGVGLGPHGWVRVAGDRWRRIATGAGRPRTGGYKLPEEEIPDLADLARTVSVHGRRVGRLRRALLRFESGLDRRGAVDALNDHLLGLRFLLDGEGPAGAGLPMRSAALVADGERRAELKEIVERGIELERELWSGEPAAAGSTSPSEIALGVEDLLRTILRRAVSGELGTDLRASADETLLADGLAIGEGAQGSPEAGAWMPEPEPALEQDEPAASAADAFEQFERDDDAEIAASRRADPRPIGPGPARHAPEPDSGPRPEQRPIPAFAAGGELPDTDSDAETETDLIAQSEFSPAAPESAGRERGQRDRPAAPAWLEEVDDGPAEPMMEFPRRPNHLRELARSPMDRAEVKARVEYLFPRTETDWTVGQDSPDRGEAPTDRGAATG